MLEVHRPVAVGSAGAELPVLPPYVPRAHDGDPARGPVLVLATLWPRLWDDLTARPSAGADRHTQARELLAGRDITVPAVFTAAQLHQLHQAADPRLAQAAAAAQDGQVTQFL